jgi:hypothetical protein
MNWSDSSHYHTVINTGKWNVDAAVKLIADAVGLMRD